MLTATWFIFTTDSLVEPIRGEFRTAATSKMERFVIIVNGFQPLTIMTKRSILDVAAVLDPPLPIVFKIKLEQNNSRLKALTL